MNAKKYVMVLTVLMATLLPVVGIAYGAPQNEDSKLWNIPFLGTMEVPKQLEIIDGKDIVWQMIKVGNEGMKLNPNAYKQGNTVKATLPEDVATMFDESQMGFYEFALKKNNTYSVAFVFAGKVPENGNQGALAFFEKLKSTDKQKQAELQQLIRLQMADAYQKVPGLKDLFQLEILEFYPFEQFANKEAQVISVGGSLAVRSFKILSPVACKVYFINKNSEIYVFGVIDNGTDRQTWDDMSKKMLSNAYWSLF